MAKGDRPKTLFLTWSDSQNPNFTKPSAFSRKGCAKAIEAACQKINAPLEAIAIFKEAHKNGAAHYHALVILEARSTKAWEIDQYMFRLHGAKTFTEIVNGGSNKPQNRILQYLMSPTPKKAEVDQSPYFSKRIEIPDVVRGKAEKARAKLENSPATPDEIFSFLVDRKDITSYEALEAEVDLGDNKKRDVRYRRISKFINNNISRASELINGLIKRRDRSTYYSDLKKSQIEYLEDCIRQCGKCVCKTGPGLTTLEEDVDFLVKFHMPKNVEPFFEWANRFFGGSLPEIGRPKNCYIIGCPTSGKSTLSDLVSHIISKRRIFTPVLDSNTPFSNMRDSYILSTCDDWRFSSKVPVTGTLQWLEGRSFGVDVKGKEPVPITRGPVCLFSSNHDNPKDNWRDVDVQAFHDRCYVVTMANKIPPSSRRPDVGEKMAMCAFCRIKALANYAPCVAKVWAKIKGGKPNAPNEQSEPPPKVDPLPKVKRDAQQDNYCPFDDPFGDGEPDIDFLDEY